MTVLLLISQLMTFRSVVCNCREEGDIVLITPRNLLSQMSSVIIEHSCPQRRSKRCPLLLSMVLLRVTDIIIVHQVAKGL